MNMIENLNLDDDVKIMLRAAGMESLRSMADSAEKDQPYKSLSPEEKIDLEKEFKRMKKHNMKNDLYNDADKQEIVELFDRIIATLKD